MAKDTERRLSIAREAIKVHPPSQFIGYQSFLFAIYKFIKERVRPYSYPIFSEDIGIGKGNVAWLIINGKRQLTDKHRKQITKKIGLSKREAEYFKELIAYSHAKELSDKEKSLNQMIGLKKELSQSSEQALHLELYSHWLHGTIFEMVATRSFDSNYAKIRQQLKFEASEELIKKSINLLESLNLIRYDERLKKYVQKITEIDSGPKVPGIGIVRYYESTMDLAKLALLKQTPAERELGSVTVSLSKEGFEKVRSAMRQFKDYIMYVAHKDQNTEAVAQLNLQLFLLSGFHAEESSDET